MGKRVPDDSIMPIERALKDLAALFQCQNLKINLKLYYYSDVKILGLELCDNLDENMSRKCQNGMKHVCKTAMIFTAIENCMTYAFFHDSL